jgi:putative transcriptional regulator
MALQSRADLIANLHSKKSRDAFVSSRVSNTLALQIRVMRQERGWSQAHLAELLGTSQNAVYRLESPQYGKPSITTLKRLASIFDVGLAVWFAPFSKLVDRAIHLTTDDILVPSFENDQGLHESEAASTQVPATTSVGNNVVFSGSLQKTTQITCTNTIDVGQLALMIGSGSGKILSLDRIPSQPIKSMHSTSKGEIRDGGRAAA